MLATLKLSENTSEKKKVLKCRPKGMIAAVFATVIRKLASSRGHTAEAVQKRR